MGQPKIWFLGVLIGVGGMLTADSGRVEAQVAFTPTIGTVPEGIGMTAVPVVSADRRYVRIGVNAGFSAIDQIQNFNIPLAAVAGGPGPSGGNGGGALAGGGFRSVGTAMGMDGPVGTNQGMNVGMIGQNAGFGAFSSFDPAYAMADDWSPAPRRARVTRNKASRSQQATARATPAATPATARPAQAKSAVKP